MVYNISVSETCTARLVLLPNLFCDRCSAFLAKMESLPWTQHMQESLEILESEKEFPSDETLVAIVKTQLVGEEARKLLMADFVGRDFGRTDPDKAPTWIHKRSLLLQLQKVRDTLPPAAASKGESTKIRACSKPREKALNIW